MLHNRAEKLLQDAEAPANVCRLLLWCSCCCRAHCCVCPAGAPATQTSTTALPELVRLPAPVSARLQAAEALMQRAYEKAEASFEARKAALQASVSGAPAGMPPT